MERTMQPSILILKPFSAAFADRILSWARNATELEFWCGLRQADARVFEGWHADPDVTAYMLLRDETPVAYGEIWRDEDEGEVELARLIVDPTERGKRLGQQLVTKLLEQIQEAGFPWAYLRVRGENAVARSCYTAVGFQRLSAADEATFNRGQPHEYVWMRCPIRLAATGAPLEDASF
jgi:ribosomal protein S18 acetylase RimI-like enzyme